jgi:hypothetical protein
MTPRFQFTLARMLAAITCLAGAAALLRFLFVEPRLFGILALLSSLTLTICAVAILARGRTGFLWALVISIVSCTLCLFVYLLFYTLFFDLPRDIRRQTHRRRVITMKAPSGSSDSSQFAKDSEMPKTPDRAVLAPAGTPAP